MKITADTNVLLRATVRDDASQAHEAESAMRRAERIVVTLPALCEFAWVLHRARKIPKPWIAVAIRALVDSPRTEADLPAVHAGLAVLELGGDFADGVIAFEGRRQGGETFVTFDRDAASLVQKLGGAVELLGPAPPA